MAFKQRWHDHATRTTSEFDFMYPYENVFGFDWEDIVQSAEQTMSSGWTAAFFQEPRREAHWTFEDASTRSQNYHAHGWAMIDPVLAAYSSSGERRFLEAALEIAMDWCQRYAHASARRKPVGVDQMAWYDMAVGLRSYRLAYIIDAAREASMLDDATDGELWRALLVHADYLSDDANIKFHNNHGFYQAAGQLAMGRRFAQKSPELAKAWRQGGERFDAMLHQQFSEEGVHLEHSPDYHRMVYRTARAMVDAGLVIDECTIAFLDDVERALSWFILPTGHIANVGDSDSHLLRVKPEQARAQWHTEEMLYAVSNGEIGVPPAEEVAVFSEAGYVAARFPSEDGPPTQASYLLQQAGFHSRTHKHADTMSFIWCDRGAQILVDSGRYGYVGKTKPGSDLHKEGFWYSDPKRIYCETTRAHNCLEFDCRDYPRRNAKPFGSAVARVERELGANVLAIETETTHFGSIGHVRLLLLRPNDFLICLDWFDDAADESHDVVQWFHFEPAIGVDARGEHAFLASLPTGNEKVACVPLLGVDGSIQKRGETEPRLQGWWSRGNRKFDPNDAVGFHQHGRQRGVLATLFQFGHDVPVAGDECSVSEDGRAGVLSWRMGSRERQVSFRRHSGEPLSIAYCEKGS